MIYIHLISNINLFCVVSHFSFVLQFTVTESSMKLQLQIAAVVILWAVTLSMAEKSTLYFVSFLPYSDPRPTFKSTWEDAEEIIPTGYLALEEINNRSDILKDYTIELIESDGGCNIGTRTVVGFAKSGILNSSKPIVGIVGPTCTDSAIAVASLTSRDEAALITIHYGTFPQLGNRTKYPYAFGTFGSLVTYAGLVTELIQNRAWKRVAILYTDTDKELYEVFHHTEKQINELPGYEIVFSSVISKIYLPMVEIQDSFAPIIVVSAPADLANMLLCMAYHRKVLYPTYQWVFIDRVISDFVNTEFSYDSKYYNCSESEMVNVAANASVSFIFSLDTSKNAGATSSGNSYEDYHRKYQKMANIRSANTTVWASPYYDSVWALALALNASLEDLKMMNFSLIDYRSGNPNITNIIAQRVYELDFEGISGRMNFDRNTGFSDRALLVTQFINGSTKQVGFYSSGNFVIYSNSQDFVNDEFEVHYDYVAVPVGIVFLIITVFTLPPTIAAQIMNIIKSDYKTIKASSRRINHLAFVGYYLVVLSIIMHMTTATFVLSNSIQSTLCNIVPWSLNVGLSLVLGSLCLKTWRIYHIFHVAMKTRRGTFIHKDYFLILIILLQILVDIIICTLWLTIDPFTIKETRMLRNKGDDPVILYGKVCHSQHIYYWLLLLTGHKALILLLALTFAILARKVHLKGFETKNVVILVYLLSIVCGLGVSLYFTTYILQLNVNISFSLLCGVLDALLYLCLIFLFLTPLYPLMKERYNMHHGVNSKVAMTKI